MSGSISPFLPQPKTDTASRTQASSTQVSNPQSQPQPQISTTPGQTASGAPPIAPAPDRAQIHIRYPAPYRIASQVSSEVLSAYRNSYLRVETYRGLIAQAKQARLFKPGEQWKFISLRYYGFPKSDVRQRTARSIDSDYNKQASFLKRIMDNLPKGNLLPKHQATDRAISGALNELVTYVALDKDGRTAAKEKQLNDALSTAKAAEVAAAGRTATAQATNGGGGSSSSTAVAAVTSRSASSMSGESVKKNAKTAEGDIGGSNKGKDKNKAKGTAEGTGKTAVRSSANALDGDEDEDYDDLDDDHSSDEELSTSPSVVKNKKVAVTSLSALRKNASDKVSPAATQISGTRASTRLANSESLRSDSRATIPTTTPSKRATASSAKTTGRPRKNPTPKKASTTPRKKTGRARVVEDDDEEDDDHKKKRRIDREEAKRQREAREAAAAIPPPTTGPLTPFSVDKPMHSSYHRDPETGIMDPEYIQALFDAQIID